MLNFFVELFYLATFNASLILLCYFNYYFPLLKLFCLEYRE